MKKGLIILTLLMVASAFAQSGSVSGRVSDLITGEPIEGMKVYAFEDLWFPGLDVIPWDSIPGDPDPKDTIIEDPVVREAITDAGGYYTIQDVPEGIYTVYADPLGIDDTLEDSIWKPELGYYPDYYPELVEIKAGEETPGIDLQMIPVGSDTCLLGGEVRLLEFDSQDWFGLVTVFSEYGHFITCTCVLPWTDDSLAPELVPAHAAYTIGWLPPVPCYVLSQAWSFSYSGDEARDSLCWEDWNFYIPQYYDHAYLMEKATLVTPSEIGRAHV